MLYESIDSISNAKNLEDKYQYQINQMNETIRIMKYEKNELEINNRKFF